MEKEEKVELNDIICPFCKEGDFDLIGLKHHLIHYCESYKSTENICNTEWEIL